MLLGVSRPAILKGKRRAGRLIGVAAAPVAPAIPGVLVGQILGTGMLSGNMRQTHAMSGSVLGIGTMTGTLSNQAGAGQNALSGSVLGTGTMTGSLTNSAGAATYTDNFNRANENLSAGANYTQDSGSAGNLVVTGNQLAAVASTTATVAWLPGAPLGSSDHYFEYDLVNVGANGPLVMCRYTDVNNWIGLRNSASAYQVLKSVAGSITVLGSHPATPAVNDRARLSVQGDTYSITINGSVFGPQTIGGDVPLSNKVGYITRTAARNPWLDNAQAGTL